jgi:hypothetical protein
MLTHPNSTTIVHEIKRRSTLEFQLGEGQDRNFEEDGFNQKFVVRLTTLFKSLQPLTTDFMQLLL